MGLSKNNLFTTKQNELARYAKVFSHPARIAVIEKLLEKKSCINTDLVSELGLAQATMSQHLKELKILGLIQGTIEGKSMSYCINVDKWKEMSSLFKGFLNIEAKNISRITCC